MNDQEKLQKFEELEKLEKEGDLHGMLRLREKLRGRLREGCIRVDEGEEESPEMRALRESARRALMRRARSYTTKKVRPPRFVWVLLAVYLGCSAAEHLSMAGVYFLDFRTRVMRGDRLP